MGVTLGQQGHGATILPATLPVPETMIIRENKIFLQLCISFQSKSVT